MYSVLHFAHHLTSRALRDGDTAIDATVGNGHDTVHLAEAVGPGGQVIGFDIQARAIARTRERLGAAGLSDRITLHTHNHARMIDLLPDLRPATVGAVMFNLGYLPGGDKSKITRPESTLRALGQSLSLVRPGGVVTVVVYTGHPGGQREAAAVEGFAASVPQDEMQIVSYRFINQRNAPPELLAFHRLAD